MILPRLSSKLLKTGHARKYFDANLNSVKVKNSILLHFVFIFQYFKQYDDKMVWCNSMLKISDKIQGFKLK